jgi:hypothetical protein
MKIASFQGISPGGDTLSSLLRAILAVIHENRHFFEAFGDVTVL